MSRRPITELVWNTKYLVLHKVGNQRRTRESLITFLEKIGGTQYVFDGRPDSGTLVLYESEILDFYEAPTGAKHWVNKVTDIDSYEGRRKEADTYEKCEHCGQPIKDGQGVTKVSDGVVFNNGEVDYQTFWTYHSEHVTVAGRGEI